MTYQITIKAITGAILTEYVYADSERKAINFVLDMVAGKLNLSIKDLELLELTTI